MSAKHTTIRDGKRLLWYSETLWCLAKDLESFAIEIEQIPELDRNCWFESTEPALREVTKHCARIHNADLSYPVILNDDGSLMDGGHRICKALLKGDKTIQAVQFSEMPKPDEEHDSQSP